MIVVNPVILIDYGIFHILMLLEILIVSLQCNRLLYH
uniref:Uncharacterized protein n=1 Tax=CrAss-like virus sp. ctt4r3 TaxID=2823619 RepID=A0A8S5L7U0_9CAUD|nr:MAG TPA: hypothetical protein [CrAss-like virus sp. ctt4r3]